MILLLQFIIFAGTFSSFAWETKNQRLSENVDDTRRETRAGNELSRASYNYSSARNKLREHYLLENRARRLGCVSADAQLDEHPDFKMEFMQPAQAFYSVPVCPIVPTSCPAVKSCVEEGKLLLGVYVLWRERSLKTMASVRKQAAAAKEKIAIAKTSDFCKMRFMPVNRDLEATIQASDEFLVLFHKQHRVLLDELKNLFTLEESLCRETTEVGYPSGDKPEVTPISD